MRNGITQQQSARLTVAPGRSTGPGFKLQRRRVEALIASAVVALLAARAPAQEAAKADDTSADALQEVVVTGTHISSRGYEAPTPVTSLSTDDLAKSAPTSIADALNKLPQFTGSSTPTAAGNIAGTTFANTPNHGNFLSLRGLGPIRTLVLLDGERLPPTTYVGTFDVDVLPQALIQRVDVVTAGASSTYGSDAIAGVVNYVIDNKFSGVKASIQRGISTRDDDGSYRASIAGGTDFGASGHILASVDYSQITGYEQNDRPYLNNQAQAVGSVVGTDAPAGTTGNPLIFVPGLRYNLASFGGLIADGPFANTTFLSPGQYHTAITGTPTGTTGFYQGGDYYYGPGFQTASVGMRNASGFARISYDLTDAITFHLQGLVAQSQDSYNGLPNLPLGLTLFSGNAYLPAPLQAQLDSTGTQSFTLDKEFIEMGPIVTRERLTNYDIFTGFDGKLGRFKWSLDYTHGDSSHHVAQGNLFQFANLAAALDAVVDPGTGQIVCGPSLSSDPTVRARYAQCAPFNPFGVGASSAAARNYTTGTSIYDADNVVNDVNARISGDLVDLPAGSLSAAAGVEYRTQKLELTSNSDPSVPVDTTGLRGLDPSTTRFYLTDIGPASGRENVREAYAEVALPLIKDVVGAQSLGINGAVRWTDYSISGSAVTWKAGLTWAPISDLRFRVTRSRDIRAPTLYDLYAGTQLSAGAAFDPQTNLNGSYVTRTSGNTNLKPEIGNTLSAGLVWQPTFLPGFGASVDYFQLAVTDAIATLSDAQILVDCYNSHNTSPECDLIKRSSPTSFPSEVDLIGINIAAIKTRGLDVETSYHRTLGPGNLMLKLFGTYVDQFLTQVSGNQPFREYAGYDATGSGNVSVVPKVKLTASSEYDFRGFGVFVQEQMIGSMKYDPTLVFAQPSVPAVFYTDLTLKYQPPLAHVTAEIFATVTNLFDKHAPMIATTFAPGLGLSTDQTLYDPTGRYFTVGVRARF